MFRESQWWQLQYRGKRRPATMDVIKKHVFMWIMDMTRALVVYKSQSYRPKHERHAYPVQQSSLVLEESFRLDPDDRVSRCNTSFFTSVKIRSANHHLADGSPSGDLVTSGSDFHAKTPSVMRSRRPPTGNSFVRSPKYRRLISISSSSQRLHRSSC